MVRGRPSKKTETPKVSDPSPLPKSPTRSPSKSPEKEVSKSPKKETRATSPKPISPSKSPKKVTEKSVPARICSDCNKSKPLTNFPKYGPSARVTFCRVCKRRRNERAKDSTPVDGSAEKSENYTKPIGGPPTVEMRESLAKDKVLLYHPFFGRIIEFMQLSKEPSEKRDQERIDRVYESFFDDFGHLFEVSKTFSPLDAYELSETGSQNTE